mgnify:CR=1 FL=1
METVETKKKVPLLNKIAYGVGTGGGCVFNQIAAAFLLQYYTDTALISAGAIATMFLVCRIFDGISDLIMGGIVDKTNTKLGKARPWLIASGPLTLLGIVLAAAPLAANIPLCALSAILLFVAFNMGNWREFVRLRQFTMSYKATLLATFFLTVIFDLTVAVEVGLGVAALFFLYRINTLTKVIKEENRTDIPKGIDIWNLEGALFFGSVSKLEEATSPKYMVAEDAPDVVIFDFTNLMSIDNSAGDIIEGFQQNVVARGKVFIIAGATDFPLRQLQRLRMDQRLGKYMVPDLESAIELAKEAQAEIQAAKPA